MSVTRKHKAAAFRPERCPKCREAYTPYTNRGSVKCRCFQSRAPKRAWINGMLRNLDGCDTCGSTMHTACFRSEAGVPL